MKYDDHQQLGDGDGNTHHRHIKASPSDHESNENSNNSSSTINSSNSVTNNPWSAIRLSTKQLKQVSIIVLVALMIGMLCRTIIPPFFSSGIDTTTITSSSVGGVTLSKLHMKNDKTFNDPTVAFVFGATGVYSTSELFKCASAMESLVKIGGWVGHIYLLIDDTSCLNKDWLNGLKKLNPHISIIHIGKSLATSTSNTEANSKTHTSGAVSGTVHGGHGNHSHTRNSHHIRRTLLNSQPFEHSMAIKTHILDFLAPQVQIAIWYDCDVIFGIPGCVRHMLHDYPLHQNITEHKPIWIPHEYHVGSFAVKQDVSLSALIQWRDAILNGNRDSLLSDKSSLPDFETFKTLFGRKESGIDPKTGHTIYTSSYEDAHYGLLPKAYHDNIPPHLIKRAFNASSSGSMSIGNSVYDLSQITQCVVHLSNGRCRHLTEKGVQDFTQSFQLQALQGKKWCPSVTRRKFKTYGLQWPFCWTPSFF